MRRYGRIVLVGALVIAVVVILGLRAVTIGRQARQEVVRLFGQITVGMDKDEVTRVFSTNKYRVLRLVQVSDDLILAQTPLEWGAGNWVLRVELLEGKVSAVRIRLLDEANIRPPGAPLDKMATNGAANR